MASVFFAHRTFPSVMEQDISVQNPGGGDIIVQFDQLGWSGEPPFKSDTKK